MLVAVALWAFSSGASAQPSARVVEGHVVALEDGDIVVDVAGKKGAATGDVVELWRPLSLKHPVTGKVIRDRFRIGALKLTQVRETLAFARPEGKLARPPEPGDVVILRSSAPELPATKPAAVELPDAPAPAADPGAELQAPGDPEARQLTRIFDGLRNADVPRRVLVYESYVRDNPNSRFAAVLYEEAQALRRLIGLAASARGVGEPELSRFERPDSALAGVPLEIGLEIAGPASGAVLHMRHAGEVAYRSTPMRKAGAGYWTATVPADRMRAPELQYFIEATTEDGKAVVLVAQADVPAKVEVHAIPRPAAPERSETTVSVWTDYADYNRLKGNDRVWQMEGFAGLRLSDVGVRALRSGFGVFRGVGGSLEELDEQHKSGRRVGLTYGYLEGEYAFTSFTALVVRGVIGLRDDGVAGGAQALVRIGNDKKTNLMIGGEVLGGVGLRGITQLELDTFERIPMLLRTEVTNQPAGSASNLDDVRPEDPDTLPTETSLERGEIGARAIAQVGYEVTAGLVLAVRGSYQGRTINHAGPGFGGAVTYTW